MADQEPYLEDEETSFLRGPEIILHSPSRQIHRSNAAAIEGPAVAMLRDRLQVVSGITLPVVEESFRFAREQVSPELIDALQGSRGPGIEGEHVAGLVVGSIQSGKTISFSTVSALCLEAGATAIVVVSGTDTNLRDQTLDRMRKYFGDMLDVVTTLEFSGSDLERSRRNIARNIADGLRKTIIVAMKEDDHLTEVRNILRLASYSIDEDAPPRVVIIDDEADQASLNNQSYKRLTNKQSTLHSILISLCENRIVAGYVGYTATAYPNALSDRTTAVYPKDFVAVLEPAEGYSGLASFFDREAKPIPAVIGFSEFVKTASIEAIDDALDYFLLLCEIRSRGEDVANLPAFPSNPDGLVMGVNSGIKVLTHEKAANQVDSRLDKWYSGQLNSADLSRLEMIFPDGTSGAFMRLLDGPTDWIKSRAQVLRSNIFVLNSSGGAPDFSSPLDRIVIGGQLLGRGFTLPNLVTYVLAPSQDKATMDVLQQRARFLGYREKFISWMRIWMLTPTVQSYRQLEKAEDAFREACRRLQEHRLGLDALEPYMVLAGNHNPARRGVIVHGKKADPSWYKSGIGAFHTDPEVQRIAEQVLGEGESRSDDRNAYRLDVDAQTARKLVEHFAISAPADRAMMQVALELAFGPKKDPDTSMRATIFVMSGWEQGRVRERDVFERVNELFSGRSGDQLGEAEVYSKETALTIQLHRLQVHGQLGVGMAIRPTEKLVNNRSAWIWD